ALIGFNRPPCRCEIYMQIAGTLMLPGYYTSGRTESTAAGPVGVVVVDDDGESDTPPRPALPPSAVLQSSQGERNKHYYWRVTPVSVTEWLAGMLHMALALDTDLAVAKRAVQVMRLAGSWNWKRKHPFQAHFVEYHPERIYDLQALLAAHPIPPDAMERRAARSAARERAQDPPAPTLAAGGAVLASPLPELPLPVLPGSTPGLPDFVIPFPAAPSNGAYNPPPFKGVALERISQIEAALQRDKIEYQIMPESARRPGRWFLLKKCLFNPTHIETQAIAVGRNGWLWAGCWHATSCGANQNVWQSVERVLRIPTAPTPAFLRADHPELAHRCLRDLRVGGEEAIIYAEGAFHRFTEASCLWEPISDPEVQRVLASYSGAQLTRGTRTREVSLSHSDVRGATRMAQALAADPTFFDRPPVGVAFRNGFLRIGDDGAVQLEALTRDHRARTYLPYDYDPNARAVTWERFLRECFRGDGDVEERVAFLQEFVGACLVGEATRYQKVLLLTGEGANGKGKFCDTVERLFPLSRVSHVKPQDLGQAYDRAALVGVLLNLVAEIPEADILAAASFKEIVTGDTVNARNPHERVISFRPIAGHIYSANSLPGTVDYSYAFFRRFEVIHWSRTFAGPDRDVFLSEKIAPDLPAIAAWALEGAQRLRKRGAYAPPPSSAEALQQWRHDVDAVAHFLRTCCERTAAGGEGTAVDMFHSALKLWLQSNSYRPLNTHTVAKRLARLGIRPEGDRYPIRLLRAPAMIVWN
ncbi:MAG: phage/plasmid primase, P4 family, partial [Dehalococcoidia bacterium]|nr:phage/plasmid primase, P4 family [Dehalococcoidia bacterium]